ncbi:ABC transporter permease subunit [Kiritimatiellota bacterium B12222]|nr:ABC transporter permease subunit [Kiritimatiellota bacterium B12222]
MALLAPATREKLARFRQMKRAYGSFWLLLLLLLTSLCSEWIANDTPWVLRFNGHTYFPRWNQELTQGDFTGQDTQTRPNYYELDHSEAFAPGSGNWMLWAPIRFSPDTAVPPEWIELSDEVLVQRRQETRVATLQMNSRGGMREGPGMPWFFGEDDPTVPEDVQQAIDLRFKNEPAPMQTFADASGRFQWSLPAFTPARRAPRSVRITLRENPKERSESPVFRTQPEDAKRPEWWGGLPPDIQEEANAKLEEAQRVPVEPLVYTDANDDFWRIDFIRETVQYPFRPVKDHPMGLDDSGRDVLVIVLYATRISLLFGLILVVSSMVLGSFLGGLQGYFGGAVDMVGQRVIEIYSSIPFLYAMIYLGSVFGRSFGLLLFIYAIFNWIGISYYMRAEFLKLRKQPFTEAALSLGLPTGRIMWKHILPNALVPIITFFPFSLVGAVGSLSALDYLGFGLPPGTPSWGNLLSQAQTHREAWWLILYPALMLFVVILLGVFIGEGLRAAFDPKREAHWEA